MSEQPTLTVYGAMWCGDCRRTKRFLENYDIPFIWHDTDASEEAAALVREMNGGRRIIPTVIFADGSFVTEPSDATMAERLGIVIENDF